jgi:hypothetical protein
MHQKRASTWDKRQKQSTLPPLESETRAIKQKSGPEPAQLSAKPNDQCRQQQYADQQHRHIGERQ